MTNNGNPDMRVPGTVTIGGDLVVGRIGFGAMQLTGPKVWGEYPDRDGGIELLKEVVDAGINFIDTADVYGPHTNEFLIHDALHPYPADLVIATKGGFVRGGPDYKDWDAVGNRVYLRQCVYTSLRRLDLDRIDLYYLHAPTASDVPFEQQMETLAELQQEGLIRHIGLSNLTAAQLRTAQRIVEIAAVTAHYNVGVRLGAELLEAAERDGIPFSPWHPAAIPRDHTASRFSSILQPIAKEYGVTVQQVALAWQLHRSPTMLPIPGTTNVAHMAENLAAASVSLTPVEVEAITDLVTEAGSDK